jgi:hypothetical protein
MIQETTGIDAIEAELNGLLRFIVDGEPVLNERAPGARPAGKPFTTFMVYWLEGHAHVYRTSEYREGAYRQAVSDDSYITSRVVCYGKDSLKRCSMIRTALKSDLAQVQNARVRLGVCDVDDIQSIPESNVDGMVRERAYMNFKFYAQVSSEFVIDYCESTVTALSVPVGDS